MNGPARRIRHETSIAFPALRPHGCAMATTIRMAEDADCDALRAIVETAYSPYVARIGRKPGPMLDDYAALVRERHVHVVERDGEPLGLIVLVPQGDGLLLDNIAVDPAAQGLGLGRALLEFAEAAALRAGHARIRLYTNEAMTENIALYAQIGYRETHRREEKGYRRVYMEKALG